MLIVAAVLAGCGSSEDAPRAGDTVATYLGALVAQDYAAACGLLLDAPPECTQPSVRSRQRVRATLPRLRDRPDWETEIDGRQATITSRAGRWQLLRRGDDWKIVVPLVRPFVTKPAHDAAAAASFGKALAEAPEPESDASGFDRAEAALPIGGPPLHVRQYILDNDRSEVIARVSTKHFRCALGRPQERRAAVAAFYREALALFRANGVADLRLIVARTGESVDSVVSFATASARAVELTAAGRATGDC